MERIILTTGGTGGHIFPALAIAEEIRARNPNAMILFMGGQYGQEADMAAKAGLDFVGLPVRGVLGRGGKGFFALFGMLRGLAKAYGIIRKVKPELVIGFGGYAGFAGVLAARFAGKATAIHEQNSYPGMTNRLLGKVVDRVFLSMPDAAGVFPAAKIIMVGNPVRASIAALYERRMQEEAERAHRAAHTDPSAGRTAEEVDGAESGQGQSKSYYGGVDAPSPFDVAGNEKMPQAAEDARMDPAAREFLQHREMVPAHAGTDEGGKPAHAPRLLVMGGSLGARAINQTMVRVISQLREAGIAIWHQTGQADYESIRTAYREAGADHVRVEAFIADMQRAYAWADLVLCRAGGSSMAEITAAGRPAILVPLPWAAQDHQRHNARFLEQEGGALILEQSEFSPEGNNKEDGSRLFARTIISLIQDRAALETMARNSLGSARPYAARDLVDELEKLLAG